MEYDRMSAEMHFPYLLNSKLLKLQKWGQNYVHVHCYFNFVIIGDLYVTKGMHGKKLQLVAMYTIIFVIDQTSQNVILF